MRVDCDGANRVGLHVSFWHIAEVARDLDNVRLADPS
jgi:hypothetical protein